MVLRWPPCELIFLRSGLGRALRRPRLRRYDRSLIADLPGGEDILRRGPIVMIVCGGSMSSPSMLAEWTVQAAAL